MFRENAIKAFSNLIDRIHHRYDTKGDNASEKYHYPGDLADRTLGHGAVAEAQDDADNSDEAKDVLHERGLSGRVQLSPSRLSSIGSAAILARTIFMDSAASG